MRDLIERQAAIDVVEHITSSMSVCVNTDECHGMKRMQRQAVIELANLPSAQPEQPIGVQDILQYLDEYLHPIVSPEHWSVYSELYDMVSVLPFAQPEDKCSECDAWNKYKNYPQEQRWIPCSGTIDIPHHEVLCCDRYGEELIGWLSYVDDQWLCESDGEMMYDPVAWREKPEPYREEGE